MQAVDELGYVPHASARALRKARAGALGLVLTDVTSPMFTDMVAGAQRAAMAAGYVLVLIDADEVEGESSLFTELISSSRLDGLLLQGGYGTAAEQLLTYSAQAPSVIVNAPGAPGVPSVQLQDEEATRMATHHLRDRGHEDIVFVSGPVGTTSQRRAEAFTSAVGLTGRDAEVTVVAGGWSAGESHDAVTRYLSAHECPTGFVVVNSGAAVGVLSALNRKGNRVPEDASVIAIHDTWFAPHLTPALSTVRLPLRNLGRVAVERLASSIGGEDVDDIVITDPGPELVLRDSTGAPTQVR